MCDHQTTKMLVCCQFISVNYGRGRSHSYVVEKMARIGADADVDENYVMYSVILYYITFNYSWFFFSSSEINQCEQFPSPCSQTCTYLNGQHACSCIAGYTMQSDRKTCLIISTGKFK